MGKVQVSTVALGVVVALVFTALGSAALFLFLGQEQNLRVTAEFEAERLAARALESLRTLTVADAGGSDPRIIGFGLYHPDGTLSSSTGRVPPTVPTGSTDSEFRFIPGDKVLEMVRPVGFHGIHGPVKKGWDGHQEPHPFPGNGYVFLSVDETGYFQKTLVYQGLVWGVPASVAVLGLLFGVLMVTNIRYRRRMENQDHLARLGESARTLVHEIRNPLGALRIQTGLLRQKFQGQGLDELQALEEEIDRLNTLTKKVSSYLKDPKGTPEFFDLAATTGDLPSRVGFPVAVSSPAGPVFVSMDRSRFFSVLDNLVRNAWESYGPGLGGEVEVQVTVQGRKAVIAVRDRGAGIDPLVQSRIFDPFFTTKSEGSGIGLALAKRFVEAVGGRLTLEPRTGGGTEALVTLPLGTSP